MTPKTYNSTFDMIAEAIKHGFIHIGGRSMLCKKCKTVNLRKFRRPTDKRTVYACKCGFRS